MSTASDRLRLNTESFTREREPLLIVNLARSIEQTTNRMRKDAATLLAQKIERHAPQKGRAFAGVVLTEEQMSAPNVSEDIRVPWSDFLGRNRGIAPIAHHSSQCGESHAHWWFDAVSQQGAWAVEASREFFVPTAWDMESLQKNDEGRSEKIQELVGIAKASQEAGLTPIVGPFVSREGSFTAKNCERVTRNILLDLLGALRRARLDLRNIGLQASMVTHGRQNEAGFTSCDIACCTENVFQESCRYVPLRCATDTGGYQDESAAAKLQHSANIFPLLKQIGRISWP